MSYSGDMEPDTQRSHEINHPLRRLLASIHVPAMQTTPQGRILFANSALAELLHYPSYEALCGASAEVFAEEPTGLRNALLQAKEKPLSDVPIVLRTRTGECVDTCATVVNHPEGWVDWLFFQDRDEQRVRQEVTRAIIHKLTQPLTIILGYSNLVVQQLPPDTPYLNLLRKVEENAQRMSEILQAMRHAVADEEERGATH
ncbi:MAG: PAS domain-containing protein [Ardenticatenia bacterium]|nr:PAS domain-containing protein [Ardenticatenia bacterium]